jgi:opacity protein-like surface antigen
MTSKNSRSAALWIALAMAAAPGLALAQTDEIQVYDATIADKGKLNLMLHNNFTPDGIKAPAFPGAVQSNHSLVGVAEWAYGVTDWFEQGLYLPLYSFSPNDGATFNGWKLRWLFVTPRADERKFFYGVNFEFSINQKQWDPRHYSSEIRPIVGWHLKPVDIIVNPILDTAYTGGFKSLDFAPSARVAYHLNDKWIVSAEHYADYGPLRSIYSAGEQFHQIWGVVNHAGKAVNIETGIGFGLNSASDKVTLKLMISRDLN